MRKVCDEKKCSRQVKGYGWCQLHYRRWKNTGSPELVLGVGNRVKHGESYTVNPSVEYWTWTELRQRCNNIKHRAYSRYGGRGIKVCKRWDSYENFLEDMGRRPEKMTIERMDNNKGYSPDNCVWASRRAQNLSKSDATRITVDGRTLSVTEWAEELHAGNRHAIYRRLEKGWSHSKAILTPVKRYNV